MDPNLLPGVVSPQDLYNLKLDTLDKWNRVVDSNKNDFSVPKPMLPDNFDPYDRDKQQNVYQGLFSDDWRVKTAAENAFKSAIDNSDAVKYNSNFTIDTPYAQASKYVDNKFGFDPTRDNEQFYYENTYANKTFMGKTLQNLARGTTRLLGGIVTKTGEMAGYLGSLVTSSISEIPDVINGTDNHHWMADIADNQFSKMFQGVEDNIKNKWAPIYKPNDWDQKGFFEKLSSGQFWSDDVADGVAFMGAMLASNYLTAGLIKTIPGVSTIGKLGIEGTSTMAKMGRGLMLATTGAKDLGGVGTWALNLTSQSALFGAQTYQDVKNDLIEKRREGKNNLSDQEIQQQAGDAAARDFKGNLAILGISSAFENRFIFQPLLKRLRGVSEGGISEGGTSRIGRAIDVSTDMSTPEEFAKATSARPEYSGLFDKTVNVPKMLSDPLSKLSFYGEKALKGAFIDGLFKMNAQVAMERAASKGPTDATAFFNQFIRQTSEGLSGKDKQAQQSILLGMVLGVLGPTVTSKALGERRKLVNALGESIENYNSARQDYLNSHNIYKTDENGEFVPDGKGGFVIDEAKLAGLYNGLKDHMSSQTTIDDIRNPVFRRLMQEQLLARFVAAAKTAGIAPSVMDRFSKLGQASPDLLTSLGFNPKTQEDLPGFINAFKEQSDIYDKVFFHSNSVAQPKDVDRKQFEKDDRDRKYNIYIAETNKRATKRAMDDFTMLSSQNLHEKYGDNPIPQSSIVQEFNSLYSQLHSLKAFQTTINDESGFYNDYFKQNYKRIQDRINEILPSLQDMEKEGSIKLANVDIKDKDGNVTRRKMAVSPDEYSEFFGSDNKLKSDKAADFNEKFSNDFYEGIKHAELSNAYAQNEYVSDKLSDVKDGYDNYLKYKEFRNNQSAKDVEANEAQAEQERREGMSEEERKAEDEQKAAEEAQKKEEARKAAEEKKQEEEKEPSSEEIKNNLKDYIKESINEADLDEDIKKQQIDALEKNDNWFELISSNADKLGEIFSPDVAANITDAIQLINDKIRQEMGAAEQPPKGPQKLLAGPKVSIPEDMNAFVVGNTTIVEHGQDVVKEQGKENGTLNAVPSEKGKENARLLGEHIAQNPNITRVLTSSVERALITGTIAADTADHIRYPRMQKDTPLYKSLGIKVIPDKMLDPLDKGKWTGLKKGLFPIRHYFEHPDEIIDGSVGATTRDFMNRMQIVYGFIDAIDPNTLGTIIVTHSSVMNALKALQTTNGIWNDETTKKFLELTGDSGIVPPKKVEEPIITSTLTPESLEALKEAFNIQEQAIILGKTYEDLLRAMGIYQNENKIDEAVDAGKMSGDVVVPSMRPNEIVKGNELNIQETGSRQARFGFLQKIADGTHKMDQFSLVLSTETSAKGNPVIKGRIADTSGNILSFDTDGNISGKGVNIIFDLDTISYNDASLPKERIEASGLKGDPLKKAKKNFKLSDVFTDKEGAPLKGVVQSMEDFIKNSRNPVTASIQAITQGQLLRPGITNNPNSLTDLSGKRETLTDLIAKKNHVFKNDGGTIVTEDTIENGTFLKSGRLNVRMRRNFNKESDGFEIVEFIPNTIADAMGQHPVLKDVIDQALTGQLPSSYTVFLNKLLDRNKFLILDMGTKVLVTDRQKFRKLLGSAEAAQSADLLSEKILKLTSIEDVLKSEINLDKELYQNTTNFKEVSLDYPDNVRDIIKNYPTFVQNNVTSSATPAVIGPGKEGYVRVNKRVIVKLDKAFPDMLNENMKTKMEEDSKNSPFLPSTEADNKAKDLLQDKADTDEDIQRSMDDLGNICEPE